jgi:PAS domain S-box-containing protein
MTDTMDKGTGPDGAAHQVAAHQAAAHQAAARDAMASAAATLGVGVAVFDRAAHFIACNRRFQSLFAGNGRAGTGTTIAGNGLLAPGVAYGAILTDHTGRMLEPGEARRMTALAARPDPVGTPLAMPLLLPRRDGSWLEVEERRDAEGRLICLWSDVTRRLDAETEVVRLQARLRDAIQSLPDGFALFDRDGRLDLHNSGFAEHYGIAPGDTAVGQRFDELLARARPAGKPPVLPATPRREPVGPLEIELADGRWIRVSETHTRDGGIVGIHSDITEFRRRQSELATRTAMLDAITYAATRIIGQGEWQSGMEELLERLGRALRVERAALHQIHQLNDGTAMRACIAEWTVEGLPPLYDDPLRRIGRLASGEQPLSGQTRDTQGALREELEANGVLAFLRVPIVLDGVRWGCMAFDDCTDERAWSPLEIEVLETAASLLAGAIQRSDLDSQLRRSRARIEAIVETALDCVMAVNASGLLVEFNPAAERTFGYARADVLGRRMDELIIPRSLRGAHRDGFARAVFGHPPAPTGRRIEVTAMRADGSEFPAELAVSLTRVDEETHVVAFLRDITQRKEAESALVDAKVKAEAATQAKTNFLNNMSHELRTPLNAIIGFAEIFKEEALGPLGSSRYREFADDIHDSGQHLLGIINDVLDMSRIEAGEHRLRPEPVDLGSVVGSCLHMLRDQAGNAGVTLVDASGPLPEILVADRRALMKILLNLLSNAVKFTLTGGRAVVGSHRDDSGALLITVTDTGIGIAPDALVHVFDPFHQADMGLNRRHGGAGLGLALCRALMDMHGGTIALASTPGQGTTVTLRFPQAAGE